MAFNKLKFVIDDRSAAVSEADVEAKARAAATDKACHNYLAHTYIAHNYIAHNYIGHNYIAHNCIARNYIARAAATDQACLPVMSIHLSIHMSYTCMCTHMAVVVGKDRYGTECSYRFIVTKVA